MPTLADIFSEMPGRFDPAKAAGMNATILFDLSGDEGGQWQAKIADGACEIVEGRPENPTATIKMAGEDYKNLVSGALNPMTAFMTGKVKVEGDLGVVMKFQSLFGM